MSLSLERFPILQVAGASINATFPKCIIFAKHFLQKLQSLATCSRKFSTSLLRSLITCPFLKHFQILYIFAKFSNISLFLKIFWKTAYMSLLYRISLVSYGIYFSSDIFEGSRNYFTLPQLFSYDQFQAVLFF